MDRTVHGRWHVSSQCYNKRIYCIVDKRTPSVYGKVLGDAFTGPTFTSRYSICLGMKRCYNTYSIYVILRFSASMFVPRAVDGVEGSCYVCCEDRCPVRIAMRGLAGDRGRHVRAWQQKAAIILYRR